jgi:hypothetical protein
MRQTLRGIVETLRGLESLSSKGFLNTQNLNLFPVFSEILPSFLMEKDSIVFVNGEKSMESYKWLLNLMLVNLYLLCIEELNKDLTNENPDVVSDLKVKESEIYNMLDPSIRHKIQKRGIGIK